MSGETVEALPVRVEFDSLGFVIGFLCPKCGGRLRIHSISSGLIFYQCEACGCISQRPLISEAKAQLLDSLKELQRPLTVEDIRRILDTTIKFDNDSKVICFLAFLSAYTNEDQINISFLAESSTGKSYIPLEIASYFPEEDVIELGYASPTAFFHEWGVLNRDEERRVQEIIINLAHKIVIFLDQPHAELLQRLRPLLSHDKKEIEIKITDKSEKFGLKTKTIKILGFPVVAFCSANSNLEEQEATRMLLLSPERTQEKLREALNLRLLRESDRAAFRKYLEEKPERKLLMQRIGLVKNSNIREIVIPENIREEIKTQFLKEHPYLKPRHIRDLSRLIALIKSHALLNFPHREREGETIKANMEDVEAAFKIFKPITVANELGVSPWLFEIYQMIASNTEEGLTITDFQGLYYQNYHQTIGWKKAYSLLKTLTSTGLLTEEPHPEDRRKLIFHPMKYLFPGPGASSTLCDLEHQIINKKDEEKIFIPEGGGNLPPGRGINILKEIPVESGVFFFVRVPPAEPCELCGAHSVEFEIKTDDGAVLRRCLSCFEEMRRSFMKVRWIQVEMGEPRFGADSL
jgi:hypothetical protein